MMRDTWLPYDTDANRHLLGYAIAHPQFCHPDSAYDPVTHRSIPGPIGTSRTKILVQFKNSWAEDMRAEKRPSIWQQQQAWADCMARAEAEIARQETA